MSLHDLANHVQSAGRGEDKVLVHMTPGEVSGLQSLAMAHGGSLTVNPETGLPEAGFLKSLLPMAIGFGLAPFTSGLSAAMITGAGYTAATGSLKKGIMAGLGAYGGAGLASGLNAMGAQAAGSGLTPNVAGAANAVDDMALANYRTFGANAGTSGVGLSTAAPSGLQLNAMSPTSSALNQTVSAATAAPTSVVPTAAGPIHSGGINMPPAVMQNPSSIPADIPGQGPRVLSRMPSELYTPDPQQFHTNLPQPNPSLDFQRYQTAGKVPDVAYDRMVASTGSYTPTPVANFSKYSVPTPEASGAVNVSGQAAAGKSAGAGMSRQFTDYMGQVGQGAKNVYAGGTEGLKALYEAMPKYSVMAGLGGTAATYYDEQREKALEEMRRRAAQSKGMIRPYEFEYNPTDIASQPYSGSAERIHFNPVFTAQTPYAAPGPEYAAAGGLLALAAGGPVEQMADMNSIGANTGYPMANLQTPAYTNPAMQRPEAMNVIAPSADAGVGAYSGEPRFAAGGTSHLGDYSDGGRLLKGPGDGVSDSIPASIGDRQPARLADGEFVVPARIVSEIGNGSTEAGARKLYAMMDRVQKARRKTVGKGQVARNTKAEKLLPA